MRYAATSCRASLSSVGASAPLGALLLAALLVPQALAADCAICHVEQSKKFDETSMKRALATAQASPILQSNPLLKYELGPYRYTIVRDDNTTTYRVTDGKSEISTPVLWAFGMGKAGQTYVFQYKGAFFESRVSYFEKTKALDLTIGAPPGIPKNLEEAAGHKLTNHDVKGCFGCHTVPDLYSVAQITEGSIHPGLRCESCHKPPAQHATNPGAAKPASFSKLSTEEISDLCGRCHRTWADIAAKGPQGVANVRFQPYRLTNSKCYDAADRRIACVACHDPHGRDEQIQQRSDAACRSCHGTQAGAKTARVCKTGTENCASCHMPRFEIENSHHGFPDHMIRIARTHDSYPN